MQLQSLELEPLPTDTLFYSSPDTCDPTCLCSRCGRVVHSGQCIIRASPGGNTEYRYHARCVGIAASEESCDCLPTFDESDVWTAADENTWENDYQSRKATAADELPEDCPACGNPLDGDHCVICNPQDDIEREVSDLFKSKRAAVEDALSLGPCCMCEKTENVRNVMMLNKRSPRRGSGCWGCVVCGLPMEGAIAVICDACFVEHEKGAPVKFVVVGAAQNGERVPLESLVEDFNHDRTKHAQMDRYWMN